MEVEGDPVATVTINNHPVSRLGDIGCVGNIYLEPLTRPVEFSLFLRSLLGFIVGKRQVPGGIFSPAREMLLAGPAYKFMQISIQVKYEL